MATMRPELKAIFGEALDRPTDEERRAYLDRVCAGDPDLRSRVDALLLAHQDAGNFLDEPASTAAWGAPPSLEAPGTRIGRYKLLQPIGEGGMGSVWMAEQQEPVKRLVALKLIQPGMDSRAVLARFEAERQALALMDHPHIAKILDGGTTGDEPGGVGPGRPYFVMELVRGQPLTDYCDARRLSIPDRLDLFVQICSAVQHAHQKGIIHRDLKPTNILVTEHDGRPVPKVIDFGLAKALNSAGLLTDRTLFTAFGMVVGTPLYMAPEQVGINALDVDTRSDIYALGAILYELLTGTTPLSKQRLKQAAWDEVRRVIREEDPQRPSTRLSSSDALPSLAATRQTEPVKLTRLVRGDLDWIVMRCLEKDRSRRYETANGLARDIERYLHDEPVDASPPSRRYRLRKFVRKHRSLIATVAIFVLLVIAGAGASAWQARRARAAERTALAAERAALTARDVAAEQLRLAKRSEARSKAVLKFFQDKVLSAARPKGQEGGVSRDVTVREALDQAEPEISKAFAGEPLVEASIRNTLGVSYWYLGAQDQALRQQQRALALRRRELGAGHAETVGAMNDVAIILLSQGKFPEAQKLLEEVVEVKRRTLGPESPITLRSANNLAVLMATQGDMEGALPLAEKTLEAQRRVEGPEKIFTLRSEYNVAIMRRFLGSVDEARTSLRGTLQTLQRVFSPEHQDTLRVMDYLGELLLDEGQAAEARELFEQALQRQRRILGATSDETILTMINLADTARVQGRLDEARKLAAEAVELHQRTLGPEHPQTLLALTILATVHRDRGRLAEAKTDYEQALSGMRRVFSPRTPELQRTMNAYAWMLATAPDPGFRDPRRAVELASEVVRASPRIRAIWTTLGVAHYRAGAWNEATTALEKSEAVVPGRFTAANGFFLAMAHWQLGKKDEARRWYGKAVQSMDMNQPNNEELRRFSAEAAELLGLEQKKRDASQSVDH